MSSQKVNQSKKILRKEKHTKKNTYIQTYLSKISKYEDYFLMYAHLTWKEDNC